MTFILSLISIGLEFWSVNQTSICESSESNVFKIINFSGEIFNNLRNDLLGTNVYKTLEFWIFLELLLTTLQCIHTTSVISKRGKFSPFSFFLWS